MYFVFVFGSHFFHFFVFSGGVMIYIDRIEVVNMLAPYAGMVLIYFVVFIVIFRIVITKRFPEEKKGALKILWPHSFLICILKKSLQSSLFLENDDINRSQVLDRVDCMQLHGILFVFKEQDNYWLFLGFLEMSILSNWWEIISFHDKKSITDQFLDHIDLWP